MATHRDYESFQIDLFEIGDPFLCCYSYLCCHCASAQSRTYLDGSSCCFNFWCLGPVVTRSSPLPSLSFLSSLPIFPHRWLSRTAYGIPGTDLDDFLIGCLCPCCSVNQILQTTKTYGYPPHAGTASNQTKFVSPLVTGNKSRPKRRHLRTSSSPDSMTSTIQK